jgi:hypothetical protein
VSYIASGGDVATETEQQHYADLAEYEAQHETEVLTYEAWAAASRLRSALQDGYLDERDRAEIRNLLLEALDLVSTTKAAA